MNTPEQNAAQRAKRRALIAAGTCPVCGDPLDREGSTCRACADAHAADARARKAKRRNEHALTLLKNGAIVTADEKLVARVQYADDELREAARAAMERVWRRRVA